MQWDTTIDLKKKKPPNKDSNVGKSHGHYAKQKLYAEKYRLIIPYI